MGAVRPYQSPIPAPTPSSLRQSMKAWLFVVIVLVAFAGLICYQYQYAQHHLPLIRAGLAAAEQEGEQRLVSIGVPVGATAGEAVKKRRFQGDSDSMWQNEPIGAEWTGLWDAPGDYAAIDAWYREKLLANGWHIFEQRVPSTVQTEYWDGKWLLIVEHNASFADEHPPHVRIRLRLTWDYWHSFER